MWYNRIVVKGTIWLTKPCESATRDILASCLLVSVHVQTSDFRTGGQGIVLVRIETA